MEDGAWRVGENVAYLDYTMLTFFSHDGLLGRWVGIELGVD